MDFGGTFEQAQKLTRESLVNSESVKNQILHVQQKILESAKEGENSITIKERYDRKLYAIVKRELIRAGFKVEDSTESYDESATEYEVTTITWTI